jgi:Cys-tRNA(Pro) deacylase
MTAHDYPVTTAVRFLRERSIDFEPRLYDYEDRGGTRHAADSLGVDEHAVIKTLVMETDDRAAIIVLMHGDREVSTRQLARLLGTKRVAPCEPAAAQRHTGYLVGGTSPFGTRNALPVYAESSIFELPLIYLNGGKRGFLLAMEPRALKESLNPIPISAAIDPAASAAL